MISSTSFALFLSFLVAHNSTAIAAPVRIRLCNALFLLGIVFAQTLNSQTSGWSGENISIERISTEQGLSSRSVSVIIQDKRGFIWIGTQDGLNKYDDEKFTVYRDILFSQHQCQSKLFQSFFNCSHVIPTVICCNGTYPESKHVMKSI